VCVSGEGAEFAPRLHIPHLQRLVQRCGHSAAPVVTQCYVQDPFCVALEGAEFAPRLHIPHLQG
jgi:hypothetical protein